MILNLQRIAVYPTYTSYAGLRVGLGWRMDGQADIARLHFIGRPCKYLRWEARWQLTLAPAYPARPAPGAAVRPALPELRRPTRGDLISS